MYAKGRKKGTIRFSVRPGDSARKVCVAGDFTEWRPLTMRRQKDGTFVKILPVAAGTHEYKYLVDGRWLADPDNSVWARNCYGTINSVLRSPL